MNIAPGTRLAWISPRAVVRLRRLMVGVALGAALLLGTASLVERHIESRDTELLARSDSFADVGGAHIHYQLTGEGQPGPTVVFLNGMAAGLEQWEHLAPYVAKFAPTLTYDRGGYGFSDGSSAHSAGEQADELAALLTKLQIDDRPIVLVAYSISASIARVYVARHPAKVAGAVFLEPYLPELEGRYFEHGPFRTYFRWMVRATASSFFGVRRMLAFVRSRRGEVTWSPSLLRFSHFWASDRELLATPETQAEVLAADPMGEVPLVLLAPRAWSSEDSYRVLAGVYDDFARSSSHGSLRYLPDGVGHGEVVEDRRSCDVLVAAIRDLAVQAR